jgi:hypothetical protein
VSLFEFFLFPLGFSIDPVTLEGFGSFYKLANSISGSPLVLSLVVVVFLPLEEAFSFEHSVFELTVVDSLIGCMVLPLSMVESVLEGAFVAHIVFEDQHPSAIELVFAEGTLIRVGVGLKSAVNFIALKVFPAELNLTDFLIGGAVEFAFPEGPTDVVLHILDDESLALWEIVLEEPEKCVGEIEEFSVAVLLPRDEGAAEEFAIW